MPNYSFNPEALNLPLHQIRFLIGDTGQENTWRLSDEEITAVAPGGAMAQATVNLAAVLLCERLAARYAGMVDISEGAASASLSQLSQQFRDLAKQLRREGSSTAPSWAQPEIITTERAPAFTRAMNGALWP